jgi:hypothetical protein
MPAEVKHKYQGVYLMFWGDTLTEQDLHAAESQWERARCKDQPSLAVLVLDTIQVANPLGAARLFANQLRVSLERLIVVNNSVPSGIIIERLHQLLPDLKIEAAPHQVVAIQRAKDLLNIPPTAPDYSCEEVV